MQDQAAPPRFRGCYNYQLTIPSNNLPRDSFIVDELNKCNLTKIGDVSVGYYPKLMMSIKDKELRHLAGDDLSKFDMIDCKDITCTCETHKSKYLQLFGDTTIEKDSIIYNTCKRTIFAAAKRQIKSAPVPDLEVARDFLHFAKTKVKQLIGDDLDDFGYSFNQWYNHLTADKQKRMDQVHEFLFGNDPLKEHYVDLAHLDPKLLHYEAICKAEIQGVDGKPRMVCSIPDLIKYVMGPICWRLEELFSLKIPTYCGGQNLTQMQDKINHYIDEGFDVVAEGDGSAFDNTQDVMLKAIDRHIYQWISSKVYHVPQELFNFVSQACYKVMDVLLVDGKKKKCLLTYAVLGTVFSGDCDTTLMNTLRMGLYNWYTNEKAGLILNKDFICFSKGDDFTVMYQSHLDRSIPKRAYDKYWLKKPKFSGPIYDGLDDRVYGIGQILKFIEFGDPNTIKFCSLRAWYVDYRAKHIFLTRDPAKFLTLSKYSRKACHFNNKLLAQYCYDQALALKTSYNGIDYFDKFALEYIKVGNYYDKHSEVMKKRYRDVVDRRVTLPLESELYDGYNRTGRMVSFKIHGSYWETMQSIERQQTMILPKDQLEVVNQQINAEFADRDIFVLDAWTP